MYFLQLCLISLFVSITKIVHPISCVIVWTDFVLIPALKIPVEKMQNAFQKNMQHLANADLVLKETLMFSAVEVRNVSYLFMRLKINPCDSLFYFFFPVIGCRNDDECPANEACINGHCGNPCQCGPNAVCEVLYHKATCKCLPGYSGNPATGCLRPINPCEPNPCGVNALCEIDNGNPICFCPKGLTGNPFKICSKYLTV